MEKKMVRISRIVFLMLVLVSLVVFGCRQAPPPGQTPPPAGGSAQMPAPAGTAQMPAPAGTAQMPGTVGTAQMPAPAGTATTQVGIPSRDPNQVQVGMTPEQVQQIMGPPEQFYQKGFIEWKYMATPIGKVDIRFKDNKVTLIEEYDRKK
jgi:hypothetical protein